MFLNQLIKLYSTRILGLLINMGSLFMIIPRISNNPNIYGLYSVVLSLMIFLQYADLGFLGAGQKYAAEAFAKKDEVRECKILGFVHYILFLAMIIYTLILIYFYFNPELIFKHINNEEKIIVKKILLIFIISSPLIVLQRVVSAIFLIRLEDYYQQYIEMSFNLIKITSVFYFFRENHYELIHYLIFVQVISAISLMFCLFLIKARYNYSFRLLISSFKFDRNVYNSTNKMAKASMLITVCYFIYYDLDLFYITNTFSPAIVAQFAIGLSILSFSKTLMNIFFSPFQIKFNHLNGLSEIGTLKKLFIFLVEFSLPITVLPVITIILMMKMMVIHWVGINYVEAVLIAQILVFQLIFNFILMPVSYLIMSTDKYKSLIIISFTIPIIYLVSFYQFNKYIGYLLLPILKTTLILINSIYSTFLVKKLFNLNLYKYLINPIFYIIPSILLQIILFFTYNKYFNNILEKNIKHLSFDIIIGVFIALISILVYFIFNSILRRRILVLIKPYFV